MTYTDRLSAGVCVLSKDRTASGRSYEHKESTVQFKLLCFCCTVCCCCVRITPFCKLCTLGATAAACQGTYSLCDRHERCFWRVRVSVCCVPFFCTSDTVSRPAAGLFPALGCGARKGPACTLLRETIVIRTHDMHKNHYFA